MRYSRISRALVIAALALAGLAAVVPAQAQFWDWGRPRRFEPYRDWWAPQPRYYEPRYRERDREGGWEPREGSGDFSRAPAATQKKLEATVNIVVMGDANADWLAYGLEDAYSEKPEIAVVRKHRTDSGLIHYDTRRDIEWPQVVREIIAAEKPKFVVMMIGNNDRQSIREKAPPVVRPKPGAPAQAGPQAQVQPPPAASQPPPPSIDAEQQAREPATAPEPAPANTSPEQARLANYGPWEFHSEKWEAAYVKRIDATISALKSAGVPVIWVGLPAQRNTKPTADSVYLNELYRSRAEKAGITYVDVWDGFVDEGGRFSPQGPDYEGQIRRLRTGDGIYFTKFGARKLAHYVDKEIQRYLVNTPAPVALPVPIEPEKQGAKPSTPSQPGSSSQRPSVGPVLPLTVTNVQSEDQLLGGGRPAARTAGSDATATRVLNKGESVPPPRGRADDFSWPRAGIEIDESKLEPTPPSPPGTPSLPSAASGAPGSGQQAANAGEQKPIQRRAPRDGFRSMPSLQQIFPFFRF